MICAEAPPPPVSDALGRPAAFDAAVDEVYAGLVLPTPREREVLFLAVARALTQPEIALELHISENTVSIHLEHIVEKAAPSIPQTGRNRRRALFIEVAHVWGRHTGR